MGAWSPIRCPASSRARILGYARISTVPGRAARSWRPRPGPLWRRRMDRNTNYVDVGKVARIMLDPKNRKRVEVIADIEESAPIDTRTLALLSLQGVTGLLFIDLEEDPKATSNGPLPMGERYPVIRSAPSDLDVLLRSLPALANHAIDLVDHMDQVFSEENVA